MLSVAISFCYVCELEHSMEIMWITLYMKVLLVLFYIFLSFVFLEKCILLHGNKLLIQ